MCAGFRKCELRPSASPIRPKGHELRPSARVHIHKLTCYAFEAFLCMSHTVLVDAEGIRISNASQADALLRDTRATFLKRHMPFSAPGWILVHVSKCLSQRESFPQPGCSASCGLLWQNTHTLCNKPGATLACSAGGVASGRIPLTGRERERERERERDRTPLTARKEVPLRSEIGQVCTDTNRMIPDSSIDFDLEPCPWYTC